MASIRANGDRVKAARRNDVEYRLMLAASYPIFLCVEVATRLTGARPHTGLDDARSSVFAAARRSADSTLSYAFMGR